MRRLGCLTPFGIGAGLIAGAVVLLTAWLSGGTMFSPGGLNAQAREGVTLGGVNSHAALGGDCAACHANPLDSRGMAGRCLDCHTDIQAQLSAPGSLHGALPDGAACLSCHTEHGGPSAALTHMNLSEFPHDRLGFVLAAHQQTSAGLAFACADCHTGLSANPRPLNSYAFDQATCVDCHTTDQPAFVVTHVADFGDDCMGCHDGVDRYSNFDHSSLALPLEGRHNEATCASCHGQVREVAGFAGLPTTCIGCHQADDVHAGAYGTDCASCHTAASWEQVTFDHNLTAFPLTGAHTTAECTTCHANHVFAGTPSACVACHAEPQVHLGQFGTDCNSCHSTSRWEGAVFAHSFPLDHGGEGTIPCATCHTNPQQYTLYTCYNCHAHPQAQTIAEHREEGISENIDDCARCHATGQKEGD